MIKMIFKSVNLKDILILIFLMIFLVPGTVFSSQTEISQDIYIFPIPEESLDPHITWEQGRSQVFTYLYDSLYSYDRKNDQYLPDLASDIINVERDGDLYKNIIPINIDKKFADRSYLTPEDVEYSILRLLLLDYPGSGSSYFWRSVFNQPDLSSFIKGVAGYSNPKHLNFKDARKIYHLIKERIFIDSDNLIIKSEEPINFMMLLSDRVSWSSIINKDYMVANNDWDGNSDTWPLYYQRSPESSPLYDNNLATSTKWRVLKWRSGKHLTLAESTASEFWYQKIESLKLFFTPGIISSFAGPFINATVNKAQLLPETSFKADSKLLDKYYNRYTISADSIIYLLKNLQEDKTDTNSIIYYKNNENHKRLINKLVSKEEGYSRDVVEVLNWSDYYNRLLNGDYKYALVERLEPFSEELGYLYTIKAEFDYPLEAKEILDKPERIIFERKGI